MKALEQHRICTGQKIKVLNVAGTGLSQEPDVAGFTRETLEQANFGL